MKILFFIFALFIYVAFSADKLSFYLNNVYATRGGYSDMYKAFNSTGNFGLINGTTSYTLFAVFDHLVSEPAVTFSSNLLKYHMVPGANAVASLPADGVLTSVQGDKIRFYRFGGANFINGVQKIDTSTYGWYWGASDITNGIFYSLAKPLVQPTALIKSKILSTTSFNNMSDANYSYFKGILNLISASFPIPNGVTFWTLFAPQNAVFNVLPEYQKKWFQVEAQAVEFVQRLAVKGTHLGFPLLDTALPSTDTITTFAGDTLTFKVYNKPLKDFSFEKSATQTAVVDLNYYDSLRDDGVIHGISCTVADCFGETSFIYPVGWPLNKPTAQEFVTQWSTFSSDLKKSFLNYPTIDVSKHLNNLINVQPQVTIPDDSTIFLVENEYYPDDGITDSTTLNYYIVPGAKKIADFDSLLNTDITTANGQTLRIVKYGNIYYINGVSEILVTDIQIDKSIIHLIKSTIPLPLPADDTSCNRDTDYCYVITKMIDEFESISEVSKFYDLFNLAKENLDLTPPYTMILPSNVVFDEVLQELYPYLMERPVDCTAYVRMHIFKGIYYPSSPDGGVYEMTNENGTTIQIVHNGDNQLQFDNQGNVVQGLSRPRSDGIYYVIKTPDVLFDYYVPPPSPTPTPTYIPVAPTITPLRYIPASSSILSVSFFLVILGCLLVLLNLQ